MRQGEVTGTGKWIGNPQGGVTAPEPLILPDPRARFAATSARLRALSDGHPMEGWLRFMAGLARAQHEAVAGLDSLPAPALAGVRQAVEARLPPLAADGHRRDPLWRVALAVLLHSCGDDCPGVHAQPSAETTVRVRKAAPQT